MAPLSTQDDVREVGLEMDPRLQEAKGMRGVDDEIEEEKETAE